MDLFNPIKPNNRKTLPVLAEEWSTCTGCELGQHRQAVNEPFIFGDGILGGVMFIAGGPNEEDLYDALPLSGKLGALLHGPLRTIGLQHYYVTHVTCCRGWEYETDPQGNVRKRRDGSPRIKDAKPSKAHTDACKRRLMEEIYLVDPKLIVTLGSSAVEAVLNKKVAVESSNSELQVALVPGAAYLPNTTAKTKKWARKQGPKGNRTLVAPLVQNYVAYPLLPLPDLDRVLSLIDDQRMGSLLHVYSTGLKRAANLYARFMQESGYTDVQESDVSDETLLEVLSNENRD